MFKRLLVLTALALATLSISASATTPFYSIYWLSNPRPCTGNPATAGLPGPVVSTYYAPCYQGTYELSICRSFGGNGAPWGLNQSITVIGYSITMELTSPTANGVAVAGIFGSTTDIFAKTAGVGTNNATEFYPPGTGITIPSGDSNLNGGGAPNSLGDVSHIDVYANCDVGGSYAVYLSVFYTSP